MAGFDAILLESWAPVWGFPNYDKLDISLTELELLSLATFPDLAPK